MPPSLSQRHLQRLCEQSAISEAVIEARGYRTITDVKDLKAFGFTSRQLQPPGLLLPVHATDGTQPFSIFRPDKPRVERRNGKERVIKYEIPAKQGVRLDGPPSCRP